MTVSPAGGPNAIEQVVWPVQLLPAEMRWILAQPERLLAKANRSPIAYGPRKRLAIAVFRQAARVNLQSTLAMLVGFVGLLAVYLGQFGNGRNRQTAGPLFVGNNGAKDAELQKKFEIEFGEPARYINEESFASFAAVHRASFQSIFREWRHAASNVRTVVRQTSPEDAPLDYLMEFALQGHRYSYCAAWFRRHAKEAATDTFVAFGAASPTVSHAAANVGVRTAYYPHGFLARTVVFPDFKAVRCSNKFEAVYIKKRLPQSDVRVIADPFDPIRTEKTALIACGHFDDPGTEGFKAFLDWARANGVRIVVRRHPRNFRETVRKWEQLHDVEFSAPAQSFRDCLESVRPRFLVSWYSTTALDALARGVAPVTLNISREENGVVPIEEFSLMWPRDIRKLYDLVENPAACRIFAEDAYEKCLHD